MIDLFAFQCFLGSLCVFAVKIKLFGRCALDPCPQSYRCIETENERRYNCIQGKLSVPIWVRQLIFNSEAVIFTLRTFFCYLQGNCSDFGKIRDFLCANVLIVIRLLLLGRMAKNEIKLFCNFQSILKNLSQLFVLIYL